MINRRTFTAAALSGAAAGSVAALSGAALSGAAAGAASFQGASLQTVRARSASVVDFGARGDGAADDSAAIQAAADSGAATVIFPPGLYRVGRPLAPRSGQVWIGDGPEVSVLALPAENVAPPFNLIHREGATADLALVGLGFVGNVGRQAARDPEGQAAFAVYIRGALRRVRIEGCRFSAFGEKRHGKSLATGGGGVVLGPSARHDDQALEDVAVENCGFFGNGNVPGVYVSGGGRPGSRRRNLRIVGNRFSGVAPDTRPQNCVYVLGGDGETRIDGVTVSDNRFDIDTYVDACIELNWVESFAVAGNTVALTGAVAHTAGLLLRDGCRGGSVTGNVFVDRSGQAMTTAIALINFQHPGVIEDVTIAGNTVRGFRWRGIAIDRGARGVVASGNRVAGAADAPIAEAFRVTDVEDVLIAGNAVAEAALGVIVTPGSAPQSGARAVTVSGNQFFRCGGAGCVIDGRGAATGLTVSGNRVVDPSPAAQVFVRGRFAPSDGGNLAIGNFTAALPESAP